MLSLNKQRQVLICRLLKCRQVRFHWESWQLLLQLLSYSEYVAQNNGSRIKSIAKARHFIFEHAVPSPSSKHARDHNRMNKNLQCKAKVAPSFFSHICLAIYKVSSACSKVVSRKIFPLAYFLIGSSF